jgi:hypothetical protein
MLEEEGDFRLSERNAPLLALFDEGFQGTALNVLHFDDETLIGLMK